jgi:hypothetical protein
MKNITFSNKKAMYFRPGSAENNKEMPCPPTPRHGYKQYFNYDKWVWEVVRVV